MRKLSAYVAVAALVFASVALAGEAYKKQIIVSLFNSPLRGVVEGLDIRSGAPVEYDIDRTLKGDRLFTSQPVIESVAPANSPPVTPAAMPPLQCDWKTACRITF